MAEQTEIHGVLKADGRRFAIVAARFNDLIVDRLVGGAVDTLAFLEDVVKRILEANKSVEPESGLQTQTRLVCVDGCVAGSLHQSLIVAVQGIVRNAIARAIEMLDTNFNLALLDEEGAPDLDEDDDDADDVDFDADFDLDDEDASDDDDGSDSGGSDGSDGESE